MSWIHVKKGPVHTCLGAVALDGQVFMMGYVTNFIFSFYELCKVSDYLAHVKQNTQVFRSKNEEYISYVLLFVL